MTAPAKSRRYGKLPLSDHLAGLAHLLQGRKHIDDKKHPSGKPYPFKSPTIAAVAAVLTVFSIFAGTSIFRPSSSSSAAVQAEIIATVRKDEPLEKCNLFSGDWVPNPDAPYYNYTCYGVHEHQNCIKFGRPNLDFLKWRWKPDGCELPIFDAEEFLEALRNKSIAFVGDSVGRNHLQSLICLLSKVQYPEHVYESKDQRVNLWKYFKYNFTVAKFWTPFLVRWNESDPDGPSKTGVFDLFLDEYDSWTSEIDDYDYIIINAGRWFYRSSVYYQNGTAQGCRYCGKPNVADLPMPYGYRAAFKTALKAINSRQSLKAVTFLRTLAPSHFENGEWNKGGNCVRTAPYRRNETKLSSDEEELYRIQLEEFEVARKEGEKKGRKFVLFDTTNAMLLRPDGHPSRYGHLPDQKVVLYNDCVHWCLPGAIDAWNDLLLELLKRRDWE